jgi:hypothetical protein
MLALNFILGISTILCIFTGVLFALLVTFYIQSIGSSKGIDSWWFKKNGLNFRYNLLNLLIWICLMVNNLIDYLLFLINLTVKGFFFYRNLPPVTFSLLQSVQKVKGEIYFFLCYLRFHLFRVLTFRNTVISLLLLVLRGTIYYLIANAIRLLQLKEKIHKIINWIVDLLDFIYFCFTIFSLLIILLLSYIIFRLTFGTVLFLYNRIFNKDIQLDSFLNSLALYDIWCVISCFRTLSDHFVGLLNFPFVVIATLFFIIIIISVLIQKLIQIVTPAIIFISKAWVLYNIYINKILINAPNSNWQLLIGPALIKNYNILSSFGLCSNQDILIDHVRNYAAEVNNYRNNSVFTGSLASKLHIRENVRNYSTNANNDINNSAFEDATGAIASYTNLHLGETKDELRLKYSKRALVYGIKNDITKQIYIGSTADGFVRLSAHLFWQSTNHTNIKLRNSILKYGLNNFTLHIFTVIEFSDSLTPKQKKDLLLPIEQAHIDKYLPLKKNQLFNFLYEVGSSLGYQHTEETKAKISASVRLTNSLSGKSRLNKNSIIRGWNGKQLYVFDSDLRLINDKPFKSKKEAEYGLKIHSSTINKYLDTNKFYLKNKKYFYFSSKLLTEEDKLRLQNLLNLQKLIVPTPLCGVKKAINRRLNLIYVYDTNLRLINNEPFPSLMGKYGLRDYLKIGRFIFNKYLDTNKPYLKNNQYFYFSSKLLTEKDRFRLYNTNWLDYVSNDFLRQSKNVWVYRKNSNDKFVPYNTEEPTFKSHRTAAAETGCGRVTIANKIKEGLTQKPVRGLYFFAEKQETE